MRENNVENFEAMCTTLSLFAHPNKAQKVLKLFNNCARYVCYEIELITDIYGYSVQAYHDMQESVREIADSCVEELTELEADTIVIDLFVKYFDMLMESEYKDQQNHPKGTRYSDFLEY